MSPTMTLDNITDEYQMRLIDGVDWLIHSIYIQVANHKDEWLTDEDRILLVGLLSDIGAAARHRGKKVRMLAKGE